MDKITMTGFKLSILDDDRHILHVRDYVRDNLGIRAVVSLIIEEYDEPVRDEVCLWRADDRRRFKRQCASWLREEDNLVDWYLMDLENLILRELNKPKSGGLETKEAA